MMGTSRIYYDDKLLNFSEMTPKERDQFELKIKKAIAKALGKRIIKVVQK